MAQRRLRDGTTPVGRAAGAIAGPARNGRAAARNSEETGDRGELVNMQTVLVAHSRDGLGGSVITGALLAKALESGGEWKTLSVCNSAGPPLDYHRTIGIDVMPLMDSQGLPFRPNPGDAIRLQRIAKRIPLSRAARRVLTS